MDSLNLCKLSSETQQPSFSWCKLFSGEVKQNQGKKKKENKTASPKHTIFPHLSLFPGIGYIQKRQSWATTTKTFVPECHARHKPKPTGNLMGKGFCKVSTLKNLSPSFESSGDSRPSIINHRFIIIFKKVRLHILNIIVMRNLFPKIHCSKCNHFWKTQTSVIFLGTLQPWSLLKHMTLSLLHLKFFPIYFLLVGG